MLCANVASANFLQENKLPALYRVHEGPNPERVENLYEFLREMGIGLARVEKPTPIDYQNLLKRLEGREDRHMIATMVIRSLMQAVYQPENLGHFGLGFDAYTHFTSPIRRYPDLMVHRAIRYLVRSRETSEHVLKVKGVKALPKHHIYPYTLSQLEDFGVKLSATERRADQATYDVLNWLKCEYMSNRLGDEFQGTVIGVTAFGLFVELKDVYVEGLVHVTALANDYYHFDAVRHTLTGERTGNSFHLGDSLTVQIAKVDLENMRIDLQLVGMAKSKGQGRALPKRVRGKKSTRKERDVKAKNRGKVRSKKRKQGL
jgi:ribonuclease R